MAKLFNKIRKTLVSEKPSVNRTTNYLKYAIGEIVLVVIGILIALSINNWNENRKNKAKETTILTTINKEFVNNKIQLDSIITYHKKALNGCDKIISYFPINVTKINLDSLSKYLKNIRPHFTFNPSQGSIKSILNTSSLEIISNTDLREILVSWSDLVLDYQEDEEGAKSVSIDLLSYFSKNFDFNYNLSDPRNNLQVLESLEFEFLIQQRRAALGNIFLKNAELEKLSKNLNKIIELSAPKK